MLSLITGFFGTVINYLWLGTCKKVQGSLHLFAVCLSILICLMCVKGFLCFVTISLGAQ